MNEQFLLHEIAAIDSS